MVEKISTHLKSAISAAVTKAEHRTSAEIAVVLVPASDPYQAYLLLYGFTAGSIAATVLWWTNTATGFPLLMLVQALAMGIFAFTPLLKTTCMKMLPQRLLHHHAARRASEEFLFLSRQVPHDRPLVLLYVSLAERYVHILHSRAASAKIPAKTWDDIVNSFTALAKKPGLPAAFESAIAKIGDALGAHFPDKGKRNALPNQVK